MLSSHRSAVAALALSCLLIGAAGTATATTARTTAATTGTAALTSLLPEAAELPGFRADGAVQDIRTVAASVGNDPAAIIASDTAHLKQDGFVDEVEQLYDYTSGGGIDNSQGLASVTAFRTQTGAHAYRNFTFALESKPSAASGTAKQTRFVQLTVSGVPGAEAAAAIGRTSKRSAVNVAWVEGRCLIQLGDSVPGTTPVKAPLVGAAQAIDKRTQHACTT